MLFLWSFPDQPFFSWQQKKLNKVFNDSCESHHKVFFPPSLSFRGGGGRRRRKKENMTNNLGGQLSSWAEDCVHHHSKRSSRWGWWEEEEEEEEKGGGEGERDLCTCQERRWKPSSHLEGGGGDQIRRGQLKNVSGRKGWREEPWWECRWTKRCVGLACLIMYREEEEKKKLFFIMFGEVDDLSLPYTDRGGGGGGGGGGRGERCLITRGGEDD